MGGGLFRVWKGEDGEEKTGVRLFVDVWEEMGGENWFGVLQLLNVGGGSCCRFPGRRETASDISSSSTVRTANGLLPRGRGGFVRRWDVLTIAQ